MGITRTDVVSILGAVLCGVILLFIAVVIVIGILLWKQHQECNNASLLTTHGYVFM